jgi:hypothetical protein
MDTADGAMLIAVISFFMAILLYIRQNNLEQEIVSIRESRKIVDAEAAQSAVMTITHHRSGERPRGSFLLSNAGKVHARDVTVNVQSYNSHPSTPVIEGGATGIDLVKAGQRITIDTTTEKDDEWPIEVLITWTDSRGPQAEVRQVSR